MCLYYIVLYIQQKINVYAMVAQHIVDAAMGVLTDIFSSFAQNQTSFSPLLPSLIRNTIIPALNLS